MQGLVDDGAIPTTTQTSSSGRIASPRGRNCRGPYCVMSYDALVVMKAHGRHALRLAEGLPDWRAAGHAVDEVPDRA